jgi:outer membrane lipoprotein SlyB
MQSRRSRRGAALVMVCLALVLTSLMGLVLIGVVGRASDRARAQAAADAAALAGAAVGRAEAAALAARNGAELVSFHASDNQVVVEVRFDGVSAVASAERRLSLDPSG